MTLLIQLRWLAVGGQLATIAVARSLMDIALPLAPLLAAITVLVAINFASLALLARGRAVTNAELTAALLFDVAALAWQLPPDRQSLVSGKSGSVRVDPGGCRCIKKKK